MAHAEGPRGGRALLPADRLRADRLPAAARPPGAVAVAISAGLLLWITVDVLRGGPLTDLDHEISDLVRDTGVRAADWPEPLFAVKLGVYAITQLGARVPVLAVLVPFIAWTAWRYRTWRPLFRLVLLLAMLTATVYALKYSIGRTAPAVDLLHTETGQSYPSGHTANAVLMWGLAAWLAAEHRMGPWLRRPLDALRWAAPLLTTLAMLLLDYHWLTDLVAGLALGVLLLRVLYAADAVTLRNWRGGRATGAGRDRGSGLAARGAGAAGGGTGGGGGGGAGGGGAGGRDTGPG
jgi:membrane-associated phospholipid phosphatase